MSQDDIIVECRIHFSEGEISPTLLKRVGLGVEENTHLVQMLRCQSKHLLPIQDSSNVEPESFRVSILSEGAAQRELEGPLHFFQDLLFVLIPVVILSADLQQLNHVASSAWAPRLAMELLAVNGLHCDRRKMIKAKGFDKLKDAYLMIR